jgi:hypothetical protein
VAVASWSSLVYVNWAVPAASVRVLMRPEVS